LLVANPEYREFTALSPVLVPVEVPEPDGAPTIAAVIPETVPVNVGEASGAKAVLRKALEPRAPVRVFKFAIVAVSPVRLVAVEALPVMLPVIGLVTVRLVSVPTEVKDELRTLEARVAPVRVPAAAGIVIFPVPSKDIPLIVLAVVNLGAETIVIIGVVAVFAIVASPSAEVTDVTVPVPPIAISPLPSKETPPIVFIFVPETKASCFPLKILQSLKVSNPRAVAEALGILKV